MKKLIAIFIMLMVVVSPIWADGDHYTPVDVSQYQNNGSITAIVLDKNGQRMTDVEVAVYNGTECRSTDMATDNGIVYITTFGDSKFDIVFHVYDRVTGQERILNQNLQYVTNMTEGTYDEPYRIYWDGCVEGDVNGDLKATISDVCSLVKYLKQGGTLSNMKAADADGNGTVDVDDVKALSDIVLKKNNR